jgi:exopolysaccharide biosynthesis polyprenyl glycosylphosphotransferase
MDIWKRKFFLSAFRVFDQLILCLAFLLAASIESATIQSLTFDQFLEMRLKVGNFILFFGMLIIWHSIFTGFRLYHSRRLDSKKSEIKDLLKASLAATLVLVVFSYLFNITMVNPLFIAVFLPAAGAALIASRLVFRFVLKKIRLHGRNQRFLLIAGTNARAIKIAQTIHSKPALGYILLGFVDEDWQGIEAVKTSGFETVSDFKHLKSYLREHVVDEVIIALPLKSMYTQAAKVLAYCEEQGVIIRHHVDMFPVKTARPHRNYLDDIPVITHYPSTVPGMQLAAKRSLDVVLSLLLLIGLSPFLALVSLLIRLDSKGPAFYVQERVGLNTRRFKLYKFRTMTDGAEAKQEELECFNEACGPVFKIKNDPRITRLGRFLRKTSIDELPQLFNVLKGDMSLVGPRPLPVRDFNGFSEDWQRRRFSVRPGITCLWQVNGRSNTSFEHWMKLDMKYIDTWSFQLDLKILLLTIPAVLRGSGAV